MRALITGGLGFIGSNLALELIQRGHSVNIIDSLDPRCGGCEDNIPRNLRNKWFDLDLLADDAYTAEQMAYLIGECDAIFHLAGHVSHRRSMEDPILDMDINCRTTLNMLQAHNGKAKIIYTGTRTQYGTIERNPVDETHPHNYVDNNGISKQMAEDYIMLHARQHENTAVSLRLANIYGPRQKLSPHQGFIGHFIKLAMEDKTLPVFGKQTRDMCYVGDAVDALILSAETDTEKNAILNIGSGIGYTLKEIAEKVVDAVGKGRVEYQEKPPNLTQIETGDYIADIAKAKHILGWAPKTSLENGLKKTAEWMTENSL